ncbi:hypothetical protein EFA46_015855 (plasmid) [Halarchaeum sp. CBA1220]|uniref:hypothetical protein n=1 Tax=Halarchaeum sp. CBA1220 TaxID=1853682 RepID=UPI000F3A83BD|nr:hypothetical protein [Halarchaeum sp. CBA1220]QLC35732.1 hypothetical protein EFA46_015855 [Halarchaeum sp. CBA1220]
MVGESFTTQAMLEVAVDDGSLKSAHDKIEAGVGDAAVTVDAAAADAGSGASSSAAGGDKFQSTRIDLAEEGLDLDARRNELLESLVDSVDKQGFQRASSGGGLSGLFAAGAGVIGTYAALNLGSIVSAASAASSALGSFSGTFVDAASAASSALSDLTDISVTPEDLVSSAASIAPPDLVAAAASLSAADVVSSPASVAPSDLIAGVPTLSAADVIAASAEIATGDVVGAAAAVTPDDLIAQSAALAAADVVAPATLVAGDVVDSAVSLKVDDVIPPLPTITAEDILKGLGIATTTKVVSSASKTPSASGSGLGFPAPAAILTGAVANAQRTPRGERNIVDSVLAQMAPSTQRTQSGSASSPRENRARTQSASLTVNSSVSVEGVSQRDLDQGMEQAKREAVKEIRREFSGGGL